MTSIPDRIKAVKDSDPFMAEIWEYVEGMDKQINELMDLESDYLTICLRQAQTIQELWAAGRSSPNPPEG